MGDGGRDHPKRRDSRRAAVGKRHGEAQARQLLATPSRLTTEQMAALLPHLIPI